MVKSVVMDKKALNVKSLKVAELPEQAKLGPNEIRIKTNFIGINRADIDAAEGRHTGLNKNGVLGFEAVGEILECGKDVTRFKEGEVVACATSPAGGALAESMVSDQKHILKMPEGVSQKKIAASVHEGMIAGYLIARAYIVQKELPILVHDVASAQGQYIARLAHFHNALVIGTIADKSEVELAQNSGCHACYSYKDPDWSSKLLKNTENYGVTCVYDGIGKDVFEQSMKALCKMGIMMMYDASSGPVENIPCNLIREKSLFVSSPSLFHYKENLNEIAISASQFFHALEVGVFEPKIAKEISLDDAPSAIAQMKQKDFQGSVIVVM